MQAGNGSGHSAFDLGVDGLVALGVPVFDAAQALQLVG